MKSSLLGAVVEQKGSGDLGEVVGIFNGRYGPVLAVRWLENNWLGWDSLDEFKLHATPTTKVVPPIRPEC